MKAMMRIVSRSGEDGVTVPKIYEQMKSKKNLLRLGTKEAKISDVEDCVFALICDSNLIPVADSEPHEVAVNIFRISIHNNLRLSKTSIHFHVTVFRS